MDPIKAKYDAARLAWLVAVAKVAELEAAMKAAKKELEIATVGQEAYYTNKQWVELTCERYPQ